MAPDGVGDGRIASGVDAGVAVTAGRQDVDAITTIPGWAAASDDAAAPS